MCADFVRVGSGPCRVRVVEFSYNRTSLVHHACNTVKLLESELSTLLLSHGRPHIGANGVSWSPWKNEWKIKKKTKTCKNSSFMYLCYILRAIRAGRYKERRYAGHLYIQIYFRMHPFVVKTARGHWPPNQNPADVPVLSLLWTYL